MSPSNPCGNYPAATNYADSYVDANGATIYSPLTPAQNAAYLAAVAEYQQCLAQVQGTPPCPLGQYWAGGLSGGIWYGHCVDDYTGQATTPDVFIPASSVPGMPPLTAQLPDATPPPIATSPPVVTPPPIVTSPPVVTPPPIVTPPPPSLPAAGTPTSKLKAEDDFAGTINGFCSAYPEDPFCQLYGGLVTYLDIVQAPTTVDQTTIVYESGLLATDVNTAIDDALGGLWTVVVGAVDVALGNIVSQVQNAVTALGNAVKAAWNILSRLGGLILAFLQQMWNAVIKGILRAVHDLANLLKGIYDDVLKPALEMLQRIRQTLLNVWKRFVVPLLVWIQDIRRVLNILAAFHIGFAQKLDQKLAQLEAKITGPFLLVLGYVNQVANWINLIVTANYLIQKPIFLWSLKAYVGESINLQLNAMNQPVDAATLAAAQQANAVPTAAQAVSDFSTFLSADGGPLADVVTTQGANLDAYLAQGV